MQFLTLHLGIPLPFDVRRQQRISQSRLYRETFGKRLTYRQSEANRLMMFIIHHGSCIGLQVRDFFFKYNFLIGRNTHSSIHDRHQVDPVSHRTGRKNFGTICRKSTSITDTHSHRPFTTTFSRRVSDRQLILVFTGRSPRFFPLWRLRRRTFFFLDCSSCFLLRLSSLFLRHCLRSLLCQGGYLRNNHRISIFCQIARNRVDTRRSYRLNGFGYSYLYIRQGRFWQYIRVDSQ